MADIPLESLTVRDGELALLSHAQHPPVAFLHTPEVRIVGKSNRVELEGGLVSFLFALNAVPDDAWVELFGAERAGSVARIQGAQADIHCTAAELEDAFAKRVDAMANTNRRDAESRVRLTVRVSDQDHATRATDELTMERMRLLRDQFDHLEL